MLRSRTPAAQSSLSKRVSACRERLQRSRKQPTRHRWGRCRDQPVVDSGIFKLCRASSLFYPQGRQAAQQETVHSRASKNGNTCSKNNPQENTRYFKACCTQGNWCVGIKETCWQIERSLTDRGFEGMRSTLKPDKPAQQVYRILA